MKILVRSKNDINVEFNYKLLYIVVLLPYGYLLLS